MTYLKLYREGVKTLSEQHIEQADYDARALLLFVTGMNLNDYLLRRTEEADDGIAERFQSLIRRRASHEPLQYLTGEADFYGRPFFVQPGVLIPRYDTETLIEAVLPCLTGTERVLDVCTGSGCILLTLLLESGNETRGVGIDISDAALSAASVNAKRLLGTSPKEAARAVFLKSDLFERVEGQFDVMVSNPPYIRSDVIAALDQEVREYEPHLALDGREDGLYFYRRITEEAVPYLMRGGLLAFEIGYDQGEAVCAILRAHDFRDVRCIRDLGNRDRVVMGRYL